MNFEDLQKSWKSQPVAPLATEEILARVKKNWNKQYRNILLRNIFTTLAFIAVFIDFAWVYSSFHKGHSIFFGGSILFMVILMITFLWVLWKGMLYKKADFSTSNKDYLSVYIEKLHWRRKTIGTYSTIYMVLLWLALMFYSWDVTQGGSILFRVGAPLAITIYCFLTWFISRRTKCKKQLAKIDALIADLRHLGDSIDL